MKRILFVLLLVAAFLPQHSSAFTPAVQGMVGSGGVVAAPASYCASKSGYLICEDFEGATSCESGSADSNCRNTWVVDSACAAAIDYSYTPLSGTYSAYNAEAGGSASCTVYTTFSAQTTAYMRGRVKIATVNPSSGAGVWIFGLRATSADLCLAGVYNSGGTMYWAVWVNTTWTASAVVAAPNTEYYVWLKGVKNANNGCELYVSTTNSKPALSIASSNQVQNNDIVRGYMRAYTGTLNGITFDEILVDDADIGD